MEAKRRRWTGRFSPSSSRCDLIFRDEVDNGVDTRREVSETLFQLRVEEGERPGAGEGVLIVSMLFPGGDIHHRGFTAEEARRIAADLLESAALVDNYNQARLDATAQVPTAA